MASFPTGGPIIPGGNIFAFFKQLQEMNRKQGAQQELEQGVRNLLSTQSPVETTINSTSPQDFSFAPVESVGEATGFAPQATPETADRANPRFQNELTKLNLVAEASGIPGVEARNPLIAALSKRLESAATAEGALPSQLELQAPRLQNQLDISKLDIASRERVAQLEVSSNERIAEARNRLQQQLQNNQITFEGAQNELNRVVEREGNQLKADMLDAEIKSRQALQATELGVRKELQAADIGSKERLAEADNAIKRDSIEVQRELGLLNVGNQAAATQSRERIAEMEIESKQNLEKLEREIRLKLQSNQISAEEARQQLASETQKAIAAFNANANALLEERRQLGATTRQGQQLKSEEDRLDKKIASDEKLTGQQIEAKKTSTLATLKLRAAEAQRSADEFRQREDRIRSEGGKDREIRAETNRLQQESINAQRDFNKAMGASKNVDNALDSIAISIKEKDPTEILQAKVDAYNNFARSERSRGNEVQFIVVDPGTFTDGIKFLDEDPAGPDAGITETRRDTLSSEEQLRGALRQ